ncbi:glutamate-5-semialdehyde dehydrogenase [Streptomyces roseoverticillatus]|uniref:glutamate-5-semialdehyde dehydrogenase n=1 Tax=Streptomyces roseoverticillatus TaxID=66429 RepID=UPI001F16E2FA|nr:glutamate-5-semialdehyde dehydrogenase [Streptomyces roseoverticillatus]MCF3103087.1 glutamate-5-semialdehyde dehydrogenase [Streptomyces roseoverticillatus]
MTEAILTSARAALAAAPPTGDPAYTRYCRELAKRLADHWPAVLDANAEDLAHAEQRGLSPVLLDRLRLTDAHLGQLERLTEAVLSELGQVTARDPGVPIGDWGVRLRSPKPLGVVFMVYEARPTVTVEGALLPVAVGNAVLLRGGKEIARTNEALSAVAREALEAAGLPADLVTVLDDPDRAQLRALLKRPDAVDVLIPRGSPSLIDYCRTASSIPVIASGGGVNHVYVHKSADLDLAAEVALDSKLPEPTACNTAEMMLVDAEAADGLVAAVLRAAERDNRQVTVRLDPRVQRPAAQAGSDSGTAGERPWRIDELQEHDLGREFLDATIGVYAVEGLDEALAHIRRHGSGHTEGVLAADHDVTEEFTRRVDAAAIVVNGSLRLHDGPTLGLGSEISISTGRMHVRGPVTLASLVTHSWVVEAHGTLRSSVTAHRS